MIQLKICGRAGNQFFQYATVYAYMKKNNIKENINISFEELKKRKTDDKSFYDTLSLFNVDDYNTIDKVKFTNYQMILDFLYRANLKVIRTIKRKMGKEMLYKDYKILDKIWHKILNKNGLYYYMPTNMNFYKSRNRNIVFYGSFESEKYFEQFRNDILKMFIPKENEKSENKELYNIIENTNSICVTIRRGDFLIDKFKKDFYICTPDYFKKAICKMNEVIEKPQYIVFSDDVDWCKNNMNFPENTMYESGKDEIWEKIRLMYSCKHFIISNSTFSWWAQYLSRNENKIVIAPKIWNKFEYCQQIYNKKWIIIN